MMHITATDKLSVTLDKGKKKPGHFWNIKNSPSPDTSLKPEKEDMSRKTRTYGNPILGARFVYLILS
jgi:hypothetical protein